ncbi:MAG TPA: hypothetical protein VEZ51_12055 [Gemmatimonadaceae bacterium]|nr:hypothetical protein [Gemmatimonadaceae bacterium]
MTRSRIWLVSAVAGVVLLTLVSCKKRSDPPSGSQFTSLLFDATSPAAREALATPVSFHLTESNYAQWEQAEGFLDALPRSAFASGSGGGGSAIDRAVAMLEASPRARTSIERTGLSVRDFVLETIALAQAAEAQTGKSTAGVTVPPENIQFVQRYQSRIMQPRTVARALRPRVNTYDEGDTTSAGVQSPTNIVPQVERGAGAPTADSATVVERGRGSDSIRRAGQRPEQPKPPVDTARDTLPR